MVVNRSQVGDVRSVRALALREAAHATHYRLHSPGAGREPYGPRRAPIEREVRLPETGHGWGWFVRAREVVCVDAAIMWDVWAEFRDPFGGYEPGPERGWLYPGLNLHADPEPELARFSRVIIDG
jgi:hypothetical protein